MGAVARLAVTGVRRRGARQVVALVLVTGLAAAAVVAGLASRRSAGDLVDAAYERAGRPDVVLYGTPDGLRGAARDPEVDAASEPALVARADTIIDGDPVEVSARAVDPDALPAVGTPDLVDGRWATAPGEIVAERSLVAGGVVDIGGTLRVTSPSGPVELRVVGSAVELSDCFWAQCDPIRVFAAQATVEQLAAGAERTVHTSSLRLVHPGLATAVGARLLRDGGPDGVFGQNTWPDTRGDILVISEVFSAMISGFGAFLVVAACVVVAGATAARLVARRRSLGLLRATGFTPRQVLVAVLAEHLIVGAVGVVLGWLLGSLVGPEIGRIDGVGGTSGSAFAPASLVAALVLVEVLLAAAVVVPAWRAGRQPATDVLRDVPASPDGGRWVAGVARRLGAGPSTVAGVRRALARPTRAALASMALLVAVVGGIVAVGFIRSVDIAIDDPARTGNPWDVFAIAAAPETAALEAAIEADPGVAGWYTEREATATIGFASYTTRLLGGDPDDAGFIVQEGRPLAGPGEAIVGYGFLDDTGASVGDRITPEIAGQHVDLEIVGWYLDTADAGKMIQIREDALPPGTVVASPTYRISASPGVDREVLADRLGAALEGRAIVAAPTFGDVGAGAITGTLLGFAVLLLAVAAANLAAATVAATRERARALGMLRTVGCTTRQLVGQGAVGSGLLGAVAGLLGAPLGILVFRLLSDAVTKGVGIGPGLAASPPWWLALVVVPGAALVGAGTGALASLSLARRPASELVRFE